MLCNYHTHTVRCKHASGKDEEYVLEAIKNGFDCLGFSDHSPWPLYEDENSRIRMELSEFDEYYKSIHSLKEKYKDQIKIYIGLECEFLEDRMDWLLNFKKEKKLDYILFGHHFDSRIRNELYFGHYKNQENCLERYKETVIKGLSTGAYLYLAHPDLFMKTYREWKKEFEKPCLEILKVCKELDIPIEYNLAGLITRSGYPCDEFWKLAGQVGNKAVIGLDAHAPEHLCDVNLVLESRVKLKQLGLEVLNHLDF